MSESEICTGWTNATVDPNKAMIGFVSCLEAGKNAWIEVRKNGDQTYPVMKKNPELDNPFNWTMMYALPRNEKEMGDHNYFNETEKDLTYNWTAAFGTREAIEAYQKDGTISEGLCKGIGICHPVKITDAEAYRKEIVGDDYKYAYYTTYWKPKNHIPYYVLDESIKDVFVVCYDDEPFDKMAALTRASDFITEYAKRMKQEEKKC